MHGGDPEFLIVLGGARPLPRKDNGPTELFERLIASPRGFAVLEQREACGCENPVTAFDQPLHG